MVNILKEQTPTPLQLRQELDTLVCQDGRGGDGLHETQPGIRYTISESARREVLTRLL